VSKTTSSTAASTATQSPYQQAGLTGMLMVLSPFPLLLPYLGTDTARIPPDLQLILATLAAACCLLCALNIEHKPGLGKIFGIAAVCAAFTALLPTMANNPFAALAGSTGLIALGTVVLDRTSQLGAIGEERGSRRLQRSRWAACTACVLAASILMLELQRPAPKIYVLATSALISQMLFLYWALRHGLWWRIGLGFGGLAAIIGALASAQPILLLGGAVLLLNLLNLLIVATFPSSTSPDGEQWWQVFTRQPARILVTTFFLLCLTGSLLLTLPIANTHGSIAPIDAAFTAVSAVCVTGLVVLDTARDFTTLGQIFILILIQLGGLGIMSITTIALHVFGHRLSLRHERLAASMTESSHHDLIQSLGLILKCTFLFEGVGAVLLTSAFFLGGRPLGSALWEGVFTAVSAFCNAGFCLQSYNLIAYQHDPAVLHTVAVLIILGGLAPATSILIPRWLSGKTVPIAVRIALSTTVVLLFTGTFFFLAFEWYGVLDRLSYIDKLHNAWLQSVTLRTAGFNSVDLGEVTAPTLLIMIVLMFIGGSPGGTAGGIKTTTLSILALTFWASITGKKYLIVQKRRIHPDTVFRAVTVTMAGVLVWFVAVMMLAITQRIGAPALIFEATSALGTVGLTIGATPLLDEIGKVIVILTMFIGRIGPVTLFMLLSDEQEKSDVRYPVERIAIT
jgi:trk system potassium uptake protein TrkH